MLQRIDQPLMLVAAGGRDFQLDPRAGQFLAVAALVIDFHKAKNGQIAHLSAAFRGIAGIGPFQASDEKLLPLINRQIGVLELQHGEGQSGGVDRADFAAPGAVAGLLAQ